MNRSHQDEIRIPSLTGVMGSGFVESSFEAGLAHNPHFIGCDAGSTDPGPEYLGSGRTAFPADAIRRDLRLMLLGARRLKIPLLIGFIRDPFIIRQIDDWTARLEEKIHSRVAMVYGEKLGAEDYLLHIRIYGKNGTMGPLEPVKEIRSHELYAPLMDIEIPEREA